MLLNNAMIPGSCALHQLNIFSFLACIELRFQVELGESKTVQSKAQNPVVYTRDIAIGAVGELHKSLMQYLGQG